MENDLKLASILDRRIRAVLEETLRSTFANELRNLVRAEMMGALGVDAPMNAVAAPRAKPGRRPKTAMAMTMTATAGDSSTCHVAGCRSPHRSRGYCSAHYQAARKHGWPMPAPEHFEPPARERARRA